MLATWPPESLKAQAVASRSFAVYHALRNSGEDYDILSSAQVYDPGRRDRRSSKAVDATKNLVLFYRKKLLLPFFSTCCGGYTEYPANVWGSEGQFPPPVACPYCREEPGFQWRARVAVADFREKLRSAGIPGARSVAVHGRSSSGERITALKVKCDDGSDRIVRINRFRMILGPNVIRSGFFESEVEDGYIVFSGRGWGHGVGMCQRGAKVLAERGESFGSILRYYFPGAVMRKMRW
jgi:stage II sporulation protein D